MKRSSARAVLLPLLLVLAAACDGRRPTVDEFLAVAPQIVRFAEEDGRRNAPGSPAEGPLFLDPRSFAASGARMVEAPIDTARLRAAVGRPFETVISEDSVLLLDETNTASGVWVKQYGVYVHLNQVRAAGDRMTVLVRNTTTDRRSFPTTLCDRVWRLIFRRQGEQGTWALSEQELRRGC